MLVMVLFGLFLVTSRAQACQQFPQPTLATAKVTLTSGSTVHEFVVELAQTDEQRACGLMGRPPLAPGHGMLFDMRPADPAYFWMENTPEPLDMLFAGSDGAIVHIERNAVPFSRRMRGTDKPVAAVLELPAGTAERLAIGIGDSLSLPW
jgi:uncharacterized membrane protein (UPF0127 family)